MNIRVQIVNAKLLQVRLERGLTLTAGIVRAIPIGIVLAVTVDVHVAVLAAIARAVQEYRALDIVAVSEAFVTVDAVCVTAAYFVVAFARLIC